MSPSSARPPTAKPYYDVYKCERARSKERARALDARLGREEVERRREAAMQRLEELPDNKWHLATDCDTVLPGREMPKRLRSEYRVDDLDTLAHMTEDVATQLIENDDDGLEHFVRAAELEFDRLANAEVQALILQQRRRRNIARTKAMKLVKEPLHPPSMNEVGSVQAKGALAVQTAPQRDHKAMMKHLDTMAKRKREQMVANLQQRQEKAVDAERLRQHNLAELELERLFRDQKVERELLSRDINEHYARLYADGTTDLGFTEQALLVFSKKYQDGLKTEQLRADLNAERDAAIQRALGDMYARQQEQVQMVKAEIRKRERLAVGQVRHACQVHAENAMAAFASRSAAERERKERRVVAAREEAAAMQRAVEGALKEADETKERVAAAFRKAHAGTVSPSPVTTAPPGRGAAGSKAAGSGGAGERKWRVGGQDCEVLLEMARHLLDLGNVNGAATYFGQLLAQQPGLSASSECHVTAFPPESCARSAPDPRCPPSSHRPYSSLPTSFPPLSPSYHPVANHADLYQPPTNLLPTIPT